MGTSQLLVAMGGILSFFFPWEDTGPDNREETEVKKVDGKEVEDDKTEVEEKMEVQAATVIVSKVTEEAMEEADYEVVEKNDDSSSSLSAFPRTPQNSFASLPSLPTGQVDESTTALDIASVAAAVAKSEDITNNETEVEASPIANLKSGVEALLIDLSAAGPQEEEDSTNKSGLEMEQEEENTTTKEENTTTKVENATNKEDNASSSTIVEQVQSIGEVQDDQQET